jgi:hypothetical protein
MSSEQKAKGKTSEEVKWKGPWLIHFFKRHRDDDPGEEVPGRLFLDARPTSVRAKLIAIITAVSEAPPQPRTEGAVSIRETGLNPRPSPWQFVPQGMGL